MKLIREFLDNLDNPVALVYSFVDGGRRLYMVDGLISTNAAQIFTTRRDAFDYGRALVNRANRKR